MSRMGGPVVVVPTTGPPPAPEPEPGPRFQQRTAASTNKTKKCTLRESKDYLLGNVPRRALELKYERQLHGVSQQRAQELQEANLVLASEVQRVQDESSCLRDEMEMLRARVAEEHDALVRARETNAQLADRVDAAESEAKKARLESGSVNEEMKILRAKLISVHKDRARIAQRLEAAQNTIARLEATSQAESQLLPAATQRAREAETRCEAMLAQVASLEGARKELEGTLKATRSAAEEQRRGAEAAAAAMKREADAAAKAMEREADAAAKAMSALDAELQEAKATNVILTAQLATARAVEEELAATKRAAAQTAKLHEQAALKLEGTRASTARLEVVLKTKEEEIRALQGDLVKAKERQQELEAAARERADAASAAQEEAHALQLKLRAAERSDTAAKEIAESEAQLREEVHTLKLKLRLAERAKEEAEAVVEQAVGLHRQRELSLEDNDKLKERLAASLARIDDLQLENSVLSDGLRRGRPYALTVREIERRRAAAKAAGTEAAHGRAPAGAGAAEAAAATSHLESDFEDADPAASSGDEAAGGKRQRRRSGRARRKMSVEDDLEARVQDLLLRRRERQLVRKEQQADFKINQPEPDTPVETEVHTDSCTDSEDNLRLAIDPPLRPRPWRAVRYPGMTQALERANQQAGPPDSDSGSDSDPELLPRGRPVLPRPTGAPVHHVPQVKGPDPALRMLPPRRRLSGGRPSSTSQDTGRASSRS